LDQDLGSAIAVLSKQVDEMTTVLAEAKETAGNSSAQLDQMTTRAEDVAGKLEIMLGALEDLPDLIPVEPEAKIVPEVPDVTEQSSVFVRHSKRIAEVDA
jgi:hypothetical protein